MDLNSSDGGGAFARPYSQNRNSDVPPQFGMSLLDYFAAAALTGLLSRSKEVIGEPQIQVHTRMAWAIAKEMIAAGNE